MIDIKFLRENPEIVKENIRKKFQDSKLALVDEVIALDEERRKPNGIRSVREYELMNQIFLKKFELSSVYND
jgi:seryl-tRNA synthetase